MEAHLVTKDGTIFSGRAFGANRSADGEVVFNTGMVGYPESLTDPSYRGQILVFTYPLIGNYGIPSEMRINGFSRYLESNDIHVRAVVVSEYSTEYSHWQGERSLDTWLKEKDIPGVCGVDTRALTRKLREHGVMLGFVHIGPLPNLDRCKKIADPNLTNLVAEVSVKEPILYQPKKFQGRRRRILLVDTGAKTNIIRCLLTYGVEVLRVPWDYPFPSEKHDGLLLTNGPGDPKTCGTTIANLTRALKNNKPVMGICLGNQLLALALGGNTYKLRYGHRGANQPCSDLKTGRCYVTSQNHGFAVDVETLPRGFEEWFRNINDGTNEGIRHKSKPIFSVQFHPEACPGPVDTEYLLEEFVEKL